MKGESGIIIVETIFNELGDHNIFSKYLLLVFREQIYFQKFDLPEVEYYFFKEKKGFIVEMIGALVNWSHFFTTLSDVIQEPHGQRYKVQGEM